MDSITSSFNPPLQSNQHIQSIKILCGGDSGCGRSTIIRKLCYSKPDPAYFFDFGANVEMAYHLYTPSSQSAQIQRIQSQLPSKNLGKHTHHNDSISNVPHIASTHPNPLPTSPHSSYHIPSTSYQHASLLPQHHVPTHAPSQPSHPSSLSATTTTTTTTTATAANPTNSINLPHIHTYSQPLPNDSQINPPVQHQPSQRLFMIEFVDLPGHKRYKDTRETLLNDIDGVILFFDARHARSEKSVKNWYHELVALQQQRSCFATTFTNPTTPYQTLNPSDISTNQPPQQHQPQPQQKQHQINNNNNNNTFQPTHSTHLNHQNQNQIPSNIPNPSSMPSASSNNHNNTISTHTLDATISTNPNLSSSIPNTINSTSPTSATSSTIPLFLIGTVINSLPPFQFSWLDELPFHDLVYVDITSIEEFVHDDDDQDPILSSQHQPWPRNQQSCPISPFIPRSHFLSSNQTPPQTSHHQESINTSQHFDSNNNESSHSPATLHLMNTLQNEYQDILNEQDSHPFLVLEALLGQYIDTIIDYKLSQPFQPQANNNMDHNNPISFSSRFETSTIAPSFTTATFDTSHSAQNSTSKQNNQKFNNLYDQEDNDSDDDDFVSQYL